MWELHVLLARACPSSLFACRDSSDLKVVDVSREEEVSETTDASVSNLFETELKLKKSRFRQAEAFWFPHVKKEEKEKR